MFPSTTPPYGHPSFDFVDRWFQGGESMQRVRLENIFNPCGYLTYDPGE